LYSHDLVVQNMELFVLRATTPGLEVTLDCRNSYFNISNVKHVQMSGIKFINCTNNIVIKSVARFNFENCFLDNLQQLWITDTMQAIVTQSFFSESRQTIHVTRTSITVSQCIFSTNCVGIYGDNSHITVYQSVFRMNTANCATKSNQVLRSGGAIYLSYSAQNFLVREGDVQEEALTIIDSTFEENGARQNGGCIFVSGTNIMINGSRFANNTAQSQGGAVYIASTRLTTDGVSVIEGSKFISNRASIGGGAIYAPASVQISNSAFVSNTAHLRGGGAIYTGGRHSNIAVTKSIFERNSAAYCGVFDIDELNHDVKIEDSTFSLNTATGNSDISSILSISGIKSDIGGVICVRNATISILNCNFTHNSAAGYGGVMYVDDSKMTVEKCAFDSNVAGYDGGVTYTEQHRVQLSINFSLFTKNRAQSGDGGVVYVGRAHSQVSISESRFGFNSATERGGVMIIYGGLLEVNSTAFYNNTAVGGGIGSACNTQTVIPDEIATAKDPDFSFCNLYDEYTRQYDRRVITTPMASPPTTEANTVTSTPTFPSTTSSDNHTTGTASSSPDPSTATPLTLSTVDDKATTIKQITPTAKETTPASITTTTTAPSTLSVVYFELNGNVYLNNSAVSLGEVGEGGNALICKTNRQDCCGSPPNRFGEFYYPSGDRVPIRIHQDNFYRQRGDSEIYLNRRANTISPIGTYSCVIPDAAGTIQILYIDLL
jgi:predicted outer membrane repeat protein